EPEDQRAPRGRGDREGSDAEEDATGAHQKLPRSITAPGASPIAVDPRATAARLSSCVLEGAVSHSTAPAPTATRPTPKTIVATPALLLPASRASAPTSSHSVS